MKGDIIFIKYFYQNDRMSAILKIKFNYEDDVQLTWNLAEIFSVTQSLILRWYFEDWHHFQELFIQKWQNVSYLENKI